MVNMIIKTVYMSLGSAICLLWRLIYMYIAMFRSTTFVGFVRSSSCCSLSFQLLPTPIHDLPVPLTRFAKYPFKVKDWLGREKKKKKDNLKIRDT